MKFCPEAGVMAEKSQEEMLADADKKEDKIPMEKLRKVADTCKRML